MARNKRGITTVVAAVIAGIFFCLPASRAANADKKADILQMTVGIIPVVEELPIVISAKEVVAPLQKVKPELEVFKSWTALEAAFRTGMVDAAGVPTVMAFKMALDGVPLKVLFPLHKGGTKLVFSFKADKNTLKGKLLGIPGSDTGQLLVLKKFLDNEGLRIGYDVRYILVPLDRSVELLKVGKIDGFVLPEPYGTMAQAEGLVKDAILGNDIMPNFVDIVFIVNPKLIKENKKAIQEWVDSLNASGNFIEKDKKETGGRQVAVAQEDVLDIPRKYIEKGFSDNPNAIHFGNLDKVDLHKALTETSNRALELEVLSGKVELSTILDDSFRKRVK